MAIDFLSIGYATTVAVGGIIGYVKAGSIPSLAAGMLFGSVLGYGSYQTSQDPNNYQVSLGTSLALAGFMGYRFYNTGKIMPAGLITALSVLMVTRFTLRALGLTSIKKCRRNEPPVESQISAAPEMPNTQLLHSIPSEVGEEVQVGPQVSQEEDKNESATVEDKLAAAEKT